MSRLANFHGIQAVALHDWQLNEITRPKQRHFLLLATLLFAQAAIMLTVWSQLYEFYAREQQYILEANNALLNQIKNFDESISRNLKTTMIAVQALLAAAYATGNLTSLLLESAQTTGNFTHDLYTEEDSWGISVKNDLDGILEELKDDAFKKKVLSAIEETEFSVEVGALELEAMEAATQLSANALLDGCTYNPLGFGPIDCVGVEIAGATFEGAAATGLSSQSLFLTPLDPEPPTRAAQGNLNQ